MPSKDEHKKKIKIDEEDTDGSSGFGGESGEIKFRDFLSGHQETRDDLLSRDEKRRLLAVYEDAHKINVRKQKDTRDERRQLKENKQLSEGHRQTSMGERNSAYKSNPILAKAAQFSGIDRQVNANPSEHLAETNEADQNSLQNEYQLRYLPQNAPKFNPKPRVP